MDLTPHDHDLIALVLNHAVQESVVTDSEADHLQRIFESLED